MAVSRLATFGLAMTLLLPAWPGALQAQRAAPDSVRLLLRAGRSAEAFAYAGEAIRSAPGDPGAYAARAVAALAVEEFDVATAAADSALALAPGVSGYQLIYGQAYLSHARADPGIAAIGKVKKGRAALERAIELDPDNLKARSTLMQFLLQAPGFAGGSRDGARRQASEIARRDRVEGLRARLEVAVAEGDKDELRDLFSEALPSLGADSGGGGPPLIGAFLEAAAGLRNEDLRESLTAQVYAAYPDHPVAAYHRARLWVIEGERLPEAEHLLLGYLSGPERRGGTASRAGAHWRLGQLYERQDREAYASEQYRLAASLDPRLKPGRRSPGRLESEL